MYDVLITGGLCPDFDGHCFRKVSVALHGGRIAALLPPEERPAAARTIDAAGKIVSPGFIDLHMHEEYFPGGSHDYDISLLLARQGVTTGVAGNCGSQHRPLSEFSAIVASNGGLPVNYAMLTGYNYLREREGLGWYDAAAPEQQASILRGLADEMEAGSWGVSFGLEYSPGISTEEMTRAVQSIRSYDPFVSIHFRADCEECMDSLREMAQLARDTGCRVQISHLSSLAGTGHNMPAALDYLAGEIAGNPLLGYDTYPYAAFCTAIGSAVFDMDWRDKWDVGYDCIQLTHGPHAGQRCTKELYEQVRRETPEASVIAFAMDEDGIRSAIVHSAGLFGSDGGVTPGYQGHPRSAGTFPRILGKYVRQEKALPLLEALDKMTRRAALRLGLTAKGQLLPGMDADLVIFDAETISDGATFTEPKLPNRGIDAVLVAGVPVVEHDQLTGALPGRLLPRP